MIIAYLVSLLVAWSAEPNIIDQELPRSSASVAFARSLMLEQE